MTYKLCPICGYEDLNQEEGLTGCPRCAADFTGNMVENKRKEAHAIYTLGRKTINAMLYLTDQRLLAIPEKLEGYGLSMALTAAVVNKMGQKSGIISIPLNQLTVKQAKQGLFGKILLVETSDGEKLKVSVPKQKEWFEAITNAIQGDS